MLETILAKDHQALLADERRLLGELRAALARHEASREDQATLDTSIGQLDELFLLVVVGEFNSGKSTFINALLGRRLLEEGVTPTTTRIHHLSFGEREERVVDSLGVERITAPVDLLRQVHIVDTPGTNALERQHETLTSDFVPRSDLVLFVTSADRPFSESERLFIDRVREWGKKLVFVVNKIDFLRLDSDVQQVEGFMVENSRRLLGFVPEIFAVSAQNALEAKLAGGDEMRLRESRFAPLERYLVTTLDATERVRLKLLNPLGVGRRLAGRYLDAAGGRIELLRDDFSTLEDIDRQLALYKEDLGREFRFRLTDVENILLEFEKQGMEFFDDTLRLPRAFDLLNKERIQAEFQRKVIGDAPQRIEKKVDKVIDWLVAAELRQWKGVTERLERRRTHHAERLVGEIGSFDYDRQQLLDTVGRVARRTIDSYDREGESRRMAQSVQTAVASTALIEVSAIGLGAIVTILATTQIADVTGILAAGTLALIGLFVLPARRRKAKQELTEKIGDLRRRLMSALTEQFDQEVERSLHRIQEAIAPYTRFVRAERERLDTMHAELTASAGALAALETRIAEM